MCSDVNMMVWVMSKYTFKTGLIGVVCAIASMPLLAETYRLDFDPGIVLPEIAVESARSDFTNKKYSVYMRQRIANRLSVTSTTGMRIGVLRYRGEKGKSMYGLGYRNELAGFEFNTILNETAVVFALERNKVLYNFQVKNEEPERDRNSTYFQFSLTGTF